MAVFSEVILAKTFAANITNNHKFVALVMAQGSPRMLAGKYQCRQEPLRSKGVYDGRELDGFGPGPDDQPDVGGLQPSP